LASVAQTADSPRVLIADDQTDVLEALRLLLKGEGYTIETATTPSGVLRALEERELDVVLIDMNYARDTTSGREGLELLQRIHELDPTLPVIVMTAWGSVEGAVDAMRVGARDYVEKPWENASLLARLSTQVELGRALRRARRLEDENELLRGAGAPACIAESAAMKQVLRTAKRVAPSEASVLITGEHGTGKDLVAACLHAASSRSDRPLVTVNAGGLSETLFDSELFGHVRGAFTDAKSDRIGRFELADRGTLFLDEIANVPPTLQAKLLRVLQTGELERVGSSRTRRVDVRVVAATNADIAEEVAAGRFREDLFFRLNTIEIAVPPLRERRDDIPPLAAHFLSRFASRYGKPREGFDEEATRALLDHPWPGNVRELEHAVERGVLMSTSALIGSADLGLHGAVPRPGVVAEGMTLAESERALIEQALRRHEGNISEAARVLGLSRSALYRRLKAHGL
jgi:DNA-binding NtrC family response regulator